MRRPEIRHLMGPLLFIGVCLVLGYGRFLIGQAPAGRDLVIHAAPMQTLVAENIRAGELPLWNAQTFGGRPLMADIQTGVGYPPNWLNWFLPIQFSLTLILLLHIVIGLAGGFVLGKGLKLDPIASALGAAIFMLGGFLSVKVQSGIHQFIYVSAWLPWQAAALVHLRKSTTGLRVGIFALSLTMGFLAGSPQLTFYSWLLVAGLAFVCLAQSADASRLRFLASVGLGFALALGICALQIELTRDLVSHSTFRAPGIDPAARWVYVTGGGLTARMLALFLSPGLFGPGADEFLYAGDVSYTEASAYIPLWSWVIFVPLGLVFLGRKRSDGWPVTSALFLAAIVGAVFFAILALGPHSPVYGALYGRLPGLDNFRVPARWLFGTVACVSVAVAITYDQWIRRLAETDRSRVPLYLAFVASGGAALGVIYLGLIDESSLGRVPFDAIASSPLAPPESQPPFYKSHVTGRAIQSIGFVVGAVLLLVLQFRSPQDRRLQWALPVLAVLELALIAWPSQPSVGMTRYKQAHYPETELIEQIRLHSTGGRVLWTDDLLDWRVDQNSPEVVTNALIMQGIPELRGYDPIDARWHARWLNLLADVPVDTPPGGYGWVPQIARPAMLTLSGVEIVLAYNDLSRYPNLEQVAMISFPEAPLRIFRNRQYRGLAFPVNFMPSADVHLDPDAAQLITARRAQDPDADPSRIVVVESTLLASGQIPTHQVDSTFQVEPISESGSAFSYQTDFPAPAVLFFSQSRYPGWTAKIDGNYAPMSIASGTYHAVAVPAGQHTVEFDYLPPAPNYELARFISLISLAVLAFLLFRPLVRRLRASSK